MAVARKVDDAESEAVLLRTSADILSHALTQMDCCAEVWDEFGPDAKAMRETVERMVERAKEHGYIEKRGRV